MSNVVFRRIGGRVVPIDMDKLSSAERKKSAVKGVAAIAGAAAVAGGTGAGVAGAVRHAAKFTVKSRIQWQNAKATLSPGQFHLPGLKTEEMAQKVIRKAAASRLISSKIFKYRNPALAAGISVAAPLAAYGAGKINEAIKGRKHEGGKVATAAAGIATAATYAVYSHQLPVKGFSKILANTVAKMKNLKTPHKAEWWK